MTPATLPPPGTLEVHYKLFGTDGVSLQSQELSHALTARGWRVHACASDLPAQAEGLLLPQLAYQSPEAVALRQRIFPATHDEPPTDAAERALVDEIHDRALPIREALEEYVAVHDIHLVHVRNLMSLPYNLPATLALYEMAVANPHIGFLLQHHDLYWEGPNARNFVTPYAGIEDLMGRILVPSLPNARHVLINPIAAEALLRRKGVSGTVVPDGFDFGRAVPPLDDAAFRARLSVLSGDREAVGIDDLVVGMPARIAINKAVELTVQFVAAMHSARAALEASPDGVGLQRRHFTSSSAIVLLLPQGEDLEDSRDYFERLLAYARDLDVSLAYGGDVVVPDRRHQPGDTAHVPFYATYRSMDLVCYTPEHEGFGNQAIEAVWARRPLVVLEYPVFKRFVAEHVPYRISLGDTEQLAWTSAHGGLHQLAPEPLRRGVDAAVSLLRDHELERAWTEADFAALRAFCGMGTVVARYVALYRELLGAVAT